ncbi:hypothetical protein EJB05_34619, partial [Eragrostis curvula]
MMRGRLLAAAREAAHEDASSPRRARRRTRTPPPRGARADAFSSERSTFCDASGSEEKVTRLSSFPRMLGSALNGQPLCRDPQLITAWLLLVCIRPFQSHYKQIPGLHTLGGDSKIYRLACIAIL